MIRLSSLVLCTALIAPLGFTAAFAEGPQEQALDKSLTETQGQDSGMAPAAVMPPPVVTAPTAPVAAPAASTPKHQKKHKAKTLKAAAPGPDERRMDQNLQPDDKTDPQDAEIRKLNGG